MKKLMDFATQIFIISSLVALVGCSSVVTKADRDTTGKYDGRWKLDIKPASSPQKVHNWRFTCRDQSGSSRSRLVVKDGEATLTWRGRQNKTYINEKGVFKFEYQGGKLRVNTSSSISAYNPDVKIFVNGNMDEDKGKGSLVIGFAEVGYAGCTSKITYERA